MTIRAFHCITSGGNWYSKYKIDGNFYSSSRNPCRFTDSDTCNLIYTTYHDKLIEAEKYKPSMAKFNQRQIR